MTELKVKAQPTWAANKEILQATIMHAVKTGDYQATLSFNDFNVSDGNALHVATDQKPVQCSMGYIDLKHLHNFLGVIIEEIGFKIQADQISYNS